MQLLIDVSKMNEIRAERERAKKKLANMGTAELVTFAREHGVPMRRVNVKVKQEVINALMFYYGIKWTEDSLE